MDGRLDGAEDTRRVNFASFAPISNALVSALTISVAAIRSGNIHSSWYER